MMWDQAIFHLHESYDQFSEKFPEISPEAYSRKRRHAKNGTLPEPQQRIWDSYRVRSSLEFEHENNESDRKDIRIPDNIVVTRPQLNIDWDTFVYATDFHAPLHHKLMIRRMIDTAHREKIRRLLIGGDFFDFPSLSSSKFPKDIPTISLDETLEVSGKLLDILFEYFDEIAILPGNHCMRLSRKLEEAMSFRRIVIMALSRDPGSHLITTDLDYVNIGDWCIAGHPRSYASVPGSDLAKVADLKNRNILGAHTHLFGMVQSASGQFWAIAPGHMTDPSITPYYMQQQGLSKYSIPTPGFVVVKNRKPVPYNDLVTEW